MFPNCPRNGKISLERNRLPKGHRRDGRMKTRLSTYKCRYCSYYHITSNKIIKLKKLRMYEKSLPT